jgi:hypothetical protein
MDARIILKYDEIALCIVVMLLLMQLIFQVVWTNVCKVLRSLLRSPNKKVFFFLLTMVLSIIQHQHQHHSLLSQASWGRLEMKPKRDEKQGDT